MQTENSSLLELLGVPGTRYVIPAYQRLYSWKERQCRELWLDLHRAARADAPHFIGTLLYGEEADDAQGVHRRAVIDGQQRLTTLTILLVALVRYLRAWDKTLADVNAGDIENRYLCVCAAEVPVEAAALNDASGMPATSVDSVGAGPAADSVAAAVSTGCRLVLSRNDRDTLFALVDGASLPANASENITGNLAYFEQLMQEDGFDAGLLWQGIKRLFVISALVDTFDNAQLIFESLNSKGMPLTTADLVRNYLLLAENHDEQARLYDEYWDPIEGMFQPDPGSLRLDNAIQGWLSVRFRKVRAKGAGEVYSVFKQYMEDEYTGTTEKLLKELRNFCLVWAENYRYHAVKKYKSSFQWAINGPSSLVYGRERKQVGDEAYAEKAKNGLGAVDEKL